LLLEACGFLLPHFVAAAEQETLGQRRIRAHLQYVEAALRQQPDPSQTREQQLERLRNLDRLHEYWVDETFPQNLSSRQPKPFLIDADGRACALAHLMIESGEEKAAKAIARRENNAYVSDMQSPEVAAWLAQSGLSVDEAAWIQPGYDWCDVCTCEVDPVCGSNGVTYLNGCYASRCRGVAVVNEGCCPPGSAVDLSIDADCPVSSLFRLASLCTSPTPTPLPRPLAEPCWGDCDSSGTVTIAELLLGVSILLGEASEQACPAMSCRSECGPGPIHLPTIDIGCLVKSVNFALGVCPDSRCTQDADCDDNNGCSADVCTPDGCIHQCLCL
jgi:hypothetical protein